MRFTVRTAVRFWGICMAKKRHLYRRGNQYWFRVSVTVAHRQRLDVRFSLRTDSMLVANRLCSILEGELARIEAEVQQVFELFSKRKVAGSNPSVPMSKIRSLVEEHFKEVLNNAHKKRREMGLMDWSADMKAEAVAKSDYIDLLLAVEARRTSVDLQRVETWLQAQVAAGRLTIERANAARQMLKARLSSGDTYPIPKTQRDWIPYRARMEFSSDDLLQLDILMLIAERDLMGLIAGDCGDARPSCKATHRHRHHRCKAKATLSIGIMVGCRHQPKTTAALTARPALLVPCQPPITMMLRYRPRPRRRRLCSQVRTSPPRSPVMVSRSKQRLKSSWTGFKPNMTGNINRIARCGPWVTC